MTVRGKIELPALALYLMVKVWYNAKFQLDWFLCNLVNCFSLLLLFVCISLFSSILVSDVHILMLLHALLLGIDLFCVLLMFLPGKFICARNICLLIFLNIIAMIVL